MSLNTMAIALVLSSLPTLAHSESITIFANGQPAATVSVPANIQIHGTADKIVVTPDGSSTKFTGHVTIDAGQVKITADEVVVSK